MREVKKDQHLNPVLYPQHENGKKHECFFPLSKDIIHGFKTFVFLSILMSEDIIQGLDVGLYYILNMRRKETLLSILMFIIPFCIISINMSWSFFTSLR